MTETYLWQNIPNQGYNKYGKGVVGPASKEALEGAVNFHAGSPDSKTMIEVLDKTTVIPNRWGGAGTDYVMNRGELKMTYGLQDAAWMDSRWQDYAKSKGVTQLVDQAGSIDINLMETTHRSATTGEYLIGKLRTPGKKVLAFKDANIGVKIPTPDMTHILSSEALVKGAAATELKPGMVIASDALGVYSPPLKNLLKKNKPTTEAGEAVFKKLSKFAKIQETAIKYADDGLIPQASATRFIDAAWDCVVKWGAKIAKYM